MKSYESVEDEFEEAWNSPYSTITENEVDKSWERFRKNLKSSKGRGYGRNYDKAGLTAAILLLLFTSYFFIEVYNPTITINNFSQIDKEVKLPDGSLVLLKQNSEIRYKERFEDARGVELKGRAFFDVVKDSLKEFHVRTRSTTTKVLGTTFYIVEKEGSGDVEISLYTGRVLVSIKNRADSWGIIPGESLVYIGGKACIKEFDSSLSFESGNEFIDINNIELENLFHFLSKRFDYKFKKNIYTKDKRVTLRINKKDSLEQIIKILTIINHTTYEINPETKEIQVLNK